MNSYERRYECPFGCAQGYREHELIRHLKERHTKYAVARKLVEFMKALRDYEETNMETEKL